MQRLSKCQSNGGTNCMDWVESTLSVHPPQRLGEERRLVSVAPMNDEFPPLGDQRPRMSQSALRDLTGFIVRSLEWRKKKNKHEFISQRVIV